MKGMSGKSVGSWQLARRSVIICQEDALAVLYNLEILSLDLLVWHHGELTLR